MVVAGGPGCFDAFDARRIVVGPQLPVRLDAAATAAEDHAGLLVPINHNGDKHAVIARNRRVVGPAHQRELVFIVVARNHHVARIEEAAVVDHLVLAVAGHRRTGPDRGVAEPAFLEFLLEFQVHHLLAVGRNARELLGIAHLVDDLHLVHHLGRQVLEGHLRIVEEEGLAAHRDLLDGFAVVFHRAVFRNLHAWHPLEQILEHLVLPHLERSGIEDNGILLDLDRVTDGRHVRCVQQLRILRELHDTQVHGIPGPVEREIMLLVVGLVAQHLDGQHVIAPRHLRDAGQTGRVGQGKVGDQRIIFGRQISRSEGHRLFGALLQHLHDDCALVPFEQASRNKLGPGRHQPAQDTAKCQKQFISHTRVFSIWTGNAPESNKDYSIVLTDCPVIIPFFAGCGSCPRPGGSGHRPSRSGRYRRLRRGRRS